MMKTRPPKPRPCPECGEPFVKLRMGQKSCTKPECAISAGRKIREKKEAKEKAAEKKETVAKLRDMDGLPILKKRAQAAFNAFIRARDEGMPCICCGAWPHPGGTDAGHYRSVGSAPHLRFDERNVHAQSKQCNKWGAGRAVDYRIGLIAKIGLSEVEALESDQSPRHYSREELIEIAATYRAKTRAMKRK